jgi:hypothetical protein
MDRIGGHNIHSIRGRPTVAVIQPQPREMAGISESKSRNNRGRSEGAMRKTGDNKRMDLGSSLRNLNKKLEPKVELQSTIRCQSMQPPCKAGETFIAIELVA